MTEEAFDVLVIGAGTAGTIIAHKAAEAGRSVAVIDTRPYGGTCVLRGCDPKKVLVGAAQLLDLARRMQHKGIGGDLRIDWPELMDFKRSFTTGVPEDVERSLARSGIATMHGRPRFIGTQELRLADRIIRAERIVLAVGSQPRSLGFSGAEHAITSTDFLELDDLPQRVVFIGGGYISFEFAHIAARAGARVTILHRHSRPLSAFDPDLVERLVVASREVGIAVELGQNVSAIGESAAGFEVRTEEGETFVAELVVHGAGRVPELDGLDLEAGGVDYSPGRGVRVNDQLQSTSNPAVYAAGDAADTSGPPLTPVAAHEAGVVVANLLGESRRSPDYSGTPSVAFTVPALARAGLLEEEARAKGLEITVRHEDTSSWYSARRTNQRHSAHKIIEDAESGRILGAHLLGDRVGDVIDLFALAIRHGLTADDLRSSILVHPSEASDVAHMV